MRERINVDTKNYLTEVQTGQWQQIARLTPDSNVLADLPETFENNYFTNTKSDNILFTVGGTGKVYQFNPTQKLLKRIDKTYFKGYNFYAPQFVRKGTLYSIGGCGFWQYSQVITFYDQGLHEWQNLLTENLGPKSFVEGYQGYSKQNDTFYSGAPDLQRQLKNYQKTNDDTMFAFDFKTLKWTAVGKINKEIPQESRSILWDGTYFLHFSEHKLFLLDPVKNEALVVENPKYSFTTTSKFYTLGDTIYNYYANQTTLIKLSKKELLKAAKPLGKFYADEAYTDYTYLLSCLALAGLATGGYLRYRKRKKLATNGINKRHFDNLEIILLKKLSQVEQAPEKYISVVQINEILKLDFKTPENQRRIRTKFLKDLNMKLLVNFQVHDAITRFQFEEDKRLTLYRLKPEVLPALSLQLLNC